MRINGKPCTPCRINVLNSNLLCLLYFFSIFLFLFVISFFSFSFIYIYIFFKIWSPESRMKGPQSRVRAESGVQSRFSFTFYYFVTSDPVHSLAYVTSKAVHTLLITFCQSSVNSLLSRNKLQKKSIICLFNISTNIYSSIVYYISLERA